MRKRLFVDMDGTLAEFKNVDTLETLYEKDYFFNLKPQVNVVETVKEIIKKDDVEVFILSAVLSDSKYALQEKNMWLNKYLPEIDKKHRIFPPCGENKKDYIPDGIRNNDFLLDDYTHNLTLWSPPAKGIKLLNGINHTKGTWQDSRLSFSRASEELATDMLSIILEEKIIKDDLVKSNKFRDIEKEVISYVKYKLDESYIFDVEILGAKVYGSRANGNAHSNSDLDVLVEFEGSIREDDMFSLLNDGDFKINGIKVDINPITKDKSGSMDEYLSVHKPKKSLEEVKSKLTNSKNETQDKMIKNKDDINR